MEFCPAAARLDFRSTDPARDLSAGAQFEEAARHKFPDCWCAHRTVMLAQSECDAAYFVCRGRGVIAASDKLQFVVTPRTRQTKVCGRAVALRPRCCLRHVAHCS